MSEVVLGLVAPIVVVASLVVAVVLILAGVYDLVGLYRGATIQRIMRKLRYPRQPHVTVLISGKATYEQLRECIVHIDRSQYRAIDVVVIIGPSQRFSSQSSQDLTSVSRHPIRLYRMRSNVSEAEGLRRGYVRSGQGDVVMALHPSSFVTPRCIKRAVAQQELFSGSIAIRYAERDEREPRLMTLLPMWTSKSHLMWRKAVQMFGAQHTTLRTGFVYPRQFVRSKSRTFPYHFDASSVVVRPYQHRPLATSVFAGQVCGGLLFASISWVVIEAAVLRITLLPFLLVYGLLSFWIFALIWSEDKAKLGQKIAMSLTVPPAYFIVLANIAVYPLTRVLTRFRTQSTLR